MRDHIVVPIVNLNADSTHPNPWKPRTMFEQHFLFWNPYKIYRGFPEDVKPIYNALAQDPFWKKMGVAAWKGFVIGSALAATDIVLISQVEGLKARLARYLFVMPPFMAMPVSYVATREALHNLYGDQKWIYFWSMLAPSAIFGAFRSSTMGAVKLFVATAWIPYAYKLNCDTGGHFLFNPRYEAIVSQEKDNIIPMSWKHDYPSRLRKFDTGPSWKKWLDKEKSGEGPEV